MPKSTYNYNKKRLMIKEARAELVLDHVRAVFEKSKRTYGYRRIRSSLITGTKDQKPFFVSEREVRDAMREGSMVARKTRKKMEYNSYAGEVDDRPANTLLCEDGTHDFYTSRPDEVVLTDVTEFKVGNKKVYLSPIIDCFDGAPVAWSISTHPNSALSDSSLKDYLSTLSKDHLPVTSHSDGGSLYRSNSWKKLCEENNVIRSMSRKGCCPDNARVEGFFGTLKEEFYHGYDWYAISPDQFIKELDSYLQWYRDERLKAFRENNKIVYDTIFGRRRRLGYVA